MNVCDCKVELKNNNNIMKYGNNILCMHLIKMVSSYKFEWK